MAARHLKTSDQLNTGKAPRIGDHWPSPKVSTKNLGHSLLGYTENRAEYETDQGIRSVSTWFPDGRLLTTFNESLIQQELGLPYETETKLADLYDLQQFRMDNPNDCFGTQHRMDLKLKQTLEQTANNNATIGTKSNQQKVVTKPLPYALRQRLLRFQLEAEKESAGPKRFRMK